MSEPPPSSLDTLIDSLALHNASPSTTPKTSANVSTSGASLPPTMKRSADEMASELNRVPLFMTHLDETDGEGGENVALEGLRAIAYEGTRAEMAGNFRENGNDCARARQWKDAKTYYTQALAALKGPRQGSQDEDGLKIEIDEKVEDAKERVIEEACYVNRALCNLELKNYRACNLDCASTLRLNQRNIKAWYRSASACLALDKISDADDACRRGLEVDPTNTALNPLSSKISARKATLAEQAYARRQHEERLTAEQSAIKTAFQERRIITRTTMRPPDTQDAAPSLSSPLDPASTLSLPVLLLYPQVAQSDLIKSFDETHTIAAHLAYILPDMPWDTDKAYSPDTVDCYVATPSGGVAKLGKKLTLQKVLESGKVEVVDGVLKLYIVPKIEAEAWVNNFKALAERERQRVV